MNITPPAELEALFEDMKKELLESNIEAALEYFIPLSQKKYRKIFTEKGEQLSSWVEAIPQIKPDYIHTDTARYTFEIQEEIDEQIETVIYDVIFVKDQYGVWKIDWF